MGRGVPFIQGRGCVLRHIPFQRLQNCCTPGWPLAGGTSSYCCYTLLSTVVCTGGSSSWLSDSTDELSPDDHQTALLVGLLSFLSLCVAAVTAATHKRCHQRLRRLLSSADNKNSSTDARNNKNNSYKSSPSGTRPLSLFLSLSWTRKVLYVCESLSLFPVSFRSAAKYTVFRKKTPTHIFFHISKNYLWI